MERRHVDAPPAQGGGPGTDDRPERLDAARARRRRPITSAVFGLLAVPLILLPWVAHRLFLVDPLAAPVGTGGRWVERERRRPRPDSPWAVDAAGRRLPRHLRWRRAVAVPAVLTVLAATAVVGYARWAAAGPGDVPAAFEGTTWWGEYRATATWLLDNAFEPLRDPRVRDVRSEHINVVDGVRRSWRPPDCDCRRLRVWMYGGSTMFGMGQRDEHTIASELARLAWEDGIALDVDNRGVPGDVHWVEARSFAWDLATEPAPDVVLFYDGANDIGAEVKGGNGDDQPLDPPVADTDAVIQRFTGNAISDLFAARAPDGADLPAPEPDRDRSTAEIGRAAATTYDRARSLSRSSAADHGVAAHWFWQPTQTDRGVVAGEPDSSGRAWGAEVRRAARGALASDVVDLGDSLDGLGDRPLFYDDVHHNELGAHAIARAMYGSLRDELARLSTGSSG